MRDDIESHEEVWKELFLRTYSEEELQKMASLITSYNQTELKKLNLAENLYVVVVDEDFDRSLIFKIIPENDDRVIEGRYYTPINLVGFNIEAGLEVDNVYKLFSYNDEPPRPYSPTYLPGDDTPYASPESPEEADAGAEAEAGDEAEDDKYKTSKYNIKFVKGKDETEE